MRKVPELSLLSYVNGSSADQVQFVDDIMYGLKEYGFIVLNDHTVDQSKVDKAYELVNEFFALPVETKLKYYNEEGGGQRGYTPFRTEHAKDNENPDLKEFWHVGREITKDHKFAKYYPLNIWPSEIAEFTKTFNELYSSMDMTSKILLEAIGRGLDVPKNFFNEMVTDGNSILRTIHYPPTQNQDTKNSVRAAAHEDINLITMLVGATDSGLELLDRDGSWLPVSSKPGEIVVDTGDMMSRLTNDVLPATTHRVVNPDDSSSRRYSMPFFVHPHPEADLTCLSSCTNETPAKYPPITAHEFLMQRLKEIGLY